MPETKETTVRTGISEVERLNILYREVGKPGNPKLGLLHGFPASSHQSLILIPALADTFHVIAMDYPGFGNSDMPDPTKYPYTFDKTSEVVEAFLKKRDQAEFRKVFRTDLNPDGVAKAIAAYVRTIVSGNSPYDRFKAGDKTALTVGAQRRLALFEGKARCVRGHAGFNFTDEGYRNIGVGMDNAEPDLGRYTVTKNEADKGAFKTPTLRDVARRGPYMHDGSEKTLADVVAFYDRGGVKNPWLSQDIKPLGLNREEQTDLVAFLHALTGEIDPEVGQPPVLPQ